MKNGRPLRCIRHCASREMFSSEKELVVGIWVKVKGTCVHVATHEANKYRDHRENTQCLILIVVSNQHYENWP